MTYNQKKDQFHDLNDKILECKKCNGTGYQPKKSKEDIDNSLNYICKRCNMTREEFDSLIITDENKYSKIKKYIIDDNTVRASGFLLTVADLCLSSVKRNIQCTCHQDRVRYFEKLRNIESVDNALGYRFDYSIIANAKNISVNKLSNRVVDSIEEALANYMYNITANVPLVSIDALDINFFDFRKLDGIVIHSFDILSKYTKESTRKNIATNFNNLIMRRIPIIIHSERREKEVFESLGISKYFNIIKIEEPVLV